METRPIIFSGPMINALLEGRKTQTRRIIKPQPDHVVRDTVWIPVKRGFFKDSGVCEGFLSPYKVGNLLWVRESYATLEEAGKLVAFYKADADIDELKSIGCSKVKPSIFMPRWASRLTLEITGVKVERLQDISEEDGELEGCNKKWYYDHAGEENLFPCERCEGWQVHVFNSMYGSSETECKACDTSRKMFKQLWQSINGKDSWEVNPWVWVLEFIVHNKNIDEVINEKAQDN